MILIKGVHLQGIYPSKRFTNIRDRLVAKEDLIQLGLLSFGRASAEKVNTQIPSYSLTGDEYFIAPTTNVTNLLTRWPNCMISSYPIYRHMILIITCYFQKYIKNAKIKVCWIVFTIIEEFLANHLGERTIFDAILSISQAERSFDTRKTSRYKT